VARAEKDLREQYDAFKRRPFPDGSPDENASQLHAELALFGTELNGLIAQTLGTSNRLIGAEEEWRYRDLRARLKSLSVEGDADAATCARSYLDYLDALWSIANLLRRT